MTSLLDDGALIHYHNVLCVANCAQSMCKSNGCAAFRGLIQRLLNHAFGSWVERRYGLIEEQNGRIANDSSGNCKSLFLAARQRLIVNRGFIALREGQQDQACKKSKSYLRKVLNEIVSICQFACFVCLSESEIKVPISSGKPYRIFSYTVPLKRNGSYISSVSCARRRGGGNSQPVEQGQFCLEVVSKAYHSSFYYQEIYFRYFHRTTSQVIPRQCFYRSRLGLSRPSFYQPVSQERSL
jgi:hypothetical protein